MNILGISGSPSQDSRTRWLVAHALADLKGRRHLHLEVRSLPAEALVLADSHHPDIQQALSAVAEADLIVVGTPIYKAAYSGLLKLFLDLLPQDALRGKTLLPLATGGSPAHLLALDYALKPVLSVLGARDILDGIYATDAQLPRLPGGGYQATPELLERLQRAVRNLPRRSSAAAHLAPGQVAPGQAASGAALDAFGAPSSAAADH